MILTKITSMIHYMHFKLQVSRSQRTGNWQNIFYISSCSATKIRSWLYALRHIHCKEWRAYQHKSTDHCSTFWIDVPYTGNFKGGPTICSVVTNWCKIKSVYIEGSSKCHIWREQLMYTLPLGNFSTENLNSSEKQFARPVEHFQTPYILVFLFQGSHFKYSKTKGRFIIKWLVTWEVLEVTILLDCSSIVIRRLEHPTYLCFKVNTSTVCYLLSIS